jgi:hypothetical protein
MMRARTVRQTALVLAILAMAVHVLLVTAAHTIGVTRAGEPSVIAMLCASMPEGMATSLPDDAPADRTHTCPLCLGIGVAAVAPPSSTGCVAPIDFIAVPIAWVAHVGVLASLGLSPARLIRGPPSSTV